MLEQYEYNKKITAAFNTLTNVVTEQIQLFAPDEAHYGQEAKQALERLKVVTMAQKRPDNYKEHCWPNKPYSAQHIRTYDISTITAMSALRVHTIIDSKIVDNFSLNEVLERLKKRAKRHCMFKDLQELVMRDITWTESINDVCYAYCQKIRYVLDILQQLILVVNKGPDWYQICQLRGWSKEIVNQYNLNSHASMINLRITTETGPHPSLQDLLVKIDNIEKSKYLFNRIYACVMPEVYHLQELADKEKQPIIAELMTTRVTYIADALQRLYKGIALNYCCIHDPVYANLSTIFELLDAKFYKRRSLREAILFSEDRLTVPNTLSLLISNTLEALHQETIHYFRPLGLNVTLYDGMQTSILVAKTLCGLTERGDFTQIKVMNPSATHINLLIDSTQLSLWYVWSFFPSVYVGKYNALILAVLYRHTEIVNYFLEKGANPQIKGGRLHDLTAESCVSLVLPGMKAAPSALQKLFSEKRVAQSNFGNSHNFHKSKEINREPTKEQSKQTRLYAKTRSLSLG